MNAHNVAGIFAAVFLATIGTTSSQLAPPGVPCRSNSDCADSRFPVGATCQSSFCMCSGPDGKPKTCASLHHFTPKAAVQNPVAPRTCKIPADCNFPNARCNSTNSMCDCEANYVMSSQRLECLPVSQNVGSVCQENRQCILSNSTCNNGQCLCATGYHYSENKCWKKIDFGGRCTNTSECSHVDSAVCNEHETCACAENSTRSSDGQKCLQRATSILDSCEETTQCVNFRDAECIDKKCACKENKVFEKSQSSCISVKSLGESCKIDSDCYQNIKEGDEQPQRCVDSHCACNENFKMEDNKCVSGASSLLSGVLTTVLLATFVLFKS